MKGLVLIGQAFSIIEKKRENSVLNPPPQAVPFDFAKDFAPPFSKGGTLISEIFFYSTKASISFTVVLS